MTGEVVSNEERATLRCNEVISLKQR